MIGSYMCTAVQNKTIVNNKVLTSTYSAQMSMLPTKLHTWSTVHELISSVCAWHRRWVCIVDDASEPDASVLLPPLVLGCWTVVGVGDGDVVRRPGLVDSIFKRFPPIGVDALKSNGDVARALLLLAPPPLLLLWLFDGEAEAKYAADWLPSNELAFCCSDNNWNVFGIFAGNGIRFCGDVFEFDGGDCCERNGFVWIGGVCRLIIRFCGPFIIWCFNSLSFAAWAWEEMWKNVNIHYFSCSNFLLFRLISVIYQWK